MSLRAPWRERRNGAELPSPRSRAKLSSPTSVSIPRGDDGWRSRLSAGAENERRRATPSGSSPANGVGASIAVVDTGPLYAVADADDRDHERALAILEDGSLQPVIPALVIAEATYLIGSRLGPEAEAGFLRALLQLDVEAPRPEEWLRIGELVHEYSDFPLGGTDASVIALAERLETDTVVTFDHRHFAAVRPRHGTAFRLLP